ncbi:Fcf2 pre-rRNA processing [Novymonas esmeraldas]|uniref:Fcf2 pre-rRNA processing n=1 Tax=Novymonas esmeraldas TaxID=1808958 RepID=A0AAW0F450_9TRYP
MPNSSSGGTSSSGSSGRGGGGVAEMMAKAVTTSGDFYSGRTGVQGVQDRKDAVREKRRAQKNTLSQWYGMTRRPLSAEEKQEVELLQYRNFVDPEHQHQAPKRAAEVGESEFMEFGYFADVGRNKRRRYKSFADEWIEENPDFEHVVATRIKRNTKANQKSKAAAAKKAAMTAAKAKEKRTSKRKSKRDIF